MSESLTCAIVGHLVGDYLLQNDWMANNKKRHSLPCAIHCFLWTVSVMGFAGWYGNHDGWKWVVVFCILFATHCIQDRTQIIVWWMREIGQTKFIEPPTGPWSIIVVDNVWHILTLWAIWRFVA